MVQAGVSTAQRLRAVSFAFHPQWVDVQTKARAEVRFDGFGFKPLRLTLDPNFDVHQIWIAEREQVIGGAPLAVYHEVRELHWPMDPCPKGQAIRIDVENRSAAPFQPRLVLFGEVFDE
jgi:hypothetical protein